MGHPPQAYTPKSISGSATGVAHEEQMPSASILFAGDYSPTSTAVDIMRDHRARVAIEEETRIAKRHAAQAEQCETSTAPEARIRAWEKLHELRLPSDAAHPIVTIIALATHLTMAEVWQVQQTRDTVRRSERPA
jgi:hypothetical protein